VLALNPPSVADGIAAALLFARGQPAGLTLIAPGLESARHSFLAAIICLPVLFVVRFHGWAMQGAPPNGVTIALAAELVGYTLGWVAFALVSRAMAQQAGRERDWPRFIAAWNWSNLVLYALLILLMVPSVLGLPGWIGNALGLAALGYAMWLEWFVTRLSLNLPGPVAVLFVLLDVALGQFLASITARISGG
jgi:hypothetical protein